MPLLLVPTRPCISTDLTSLAASTDLAGPRFAALGATLATAARACAAELRSLRGQPQQAEADLAALARAVPADPWLALLRAELAERRGDDAAAALRWREALADTPGIYARAEIGRAHV